jgi:hypothetical protein
MLGNRSIGWGSWHMCLIERYSLLGGDSCDMTTRYITECHGWTQVDAA